MPPRTSLHARLDPLEGRWRGGGEILPNPWGGAGPTAGGWTFRFDNRRVNLIHDYAEQRAGGEVFDGHGVLTVDPATETILWFWFDSYGFPPAAPSRGRWDGDRLILEKETARGLGRSTFTIDGELLTYSAETRLIGEARFSTVTTGRYRRS